jgi:hypothetical protein
VSDKRGKRAPAVFDDVAFAEDLVRSGESGRLAAERARTEYEHDGVPIQHLLSCDEEAQDGTSLANCVKIYIPQPAGKFGMVFRIERRDRRLLLAFAAFGVRHHPSGSNALSVYEIAHRRLR